MCLRRRGEGFGFIHWTSLVRFIGMGGKAEGRPLGSGGMGPYFLFWSIARRRKKWADYSYDSGYFSIDGKRWPYNSIGD